MKASISKGSISGRITAPSSKSYTIRGLFCAAMAKGESEIIRPLGSDDTEAAFEVLSKIGVRIERRKDSWRVSGGDFHKPETDLFCHESALTIRFMTAIASLVPGRCRLIAAPSLARRPIEPLLEALVRLGVNCHFQSEPPAVVVNGTGHIGNTVSLAGNVSSQFVSALLLVSPFADKGMTILITTPLESQSFVIMTLECLKVFGVEVEASNDLRTLRTLGQQYRAAKYLVEGDWTSASYFLALGALGGEVIVDNLNPDSLQGDKCLTGFLKQMGAEVTISGNSVRVKGTKLKAIDADLNECIDLLPTMAVLCSFAKGESRLTGIARARFKESNRIAAVRDGLERMGIKAVESEESLTITGGNPKGAVIDSQNDHRIAMAFSLLGVLAGGTTIEKAECVGKTFPGYWEALQSIGGEVKLDEK